MKCDSFILINHYFLQLTAINLVKLISISGYLRPSVLRLRSMQSYVPLRTQLSKSVSLFEIILLN